MRLRDQLAVPDDPVLVPEAGTAQVDAASPDGEPLVEVDGAVVTDEDLCRQRLEPAVADRLVAAGVRLEVLDAGDLEVDDEGGVVRDSLRVGLREADTDLGREREALHARSLRSACVG